MGSVTQVLNAPVVYPATTFPLLISAWHASTTVHHAQMKIVAQVALMGTSSRWMFASPVLPTAGSATV